jgi:hypothetical protein
LIGKAKGQIAAIITRSALTSSGVESVERNTPPQLTPIARLAGFT